MMWWILLTMVLAAAVTMVWAMGNPTIYMAEFLGVFEGSFIIIGLVVYTIKSLLRK